MDRQAKSIALEKAHVHDVYEKIAPHFTDTRYKAWPRVKEFLLQLEPGSIIADIGCGNGRYLPINGETFKIGSDRCERLVDIANKNSYEVMVCDNIRLPYRDNCFDAVISIAVIHHFATVERRIQALQELSRILRPGGKLMVYVWAMEQKQRKFDSQDVLVPWHLQPRYHKHKARRLQDLKNENSSYCSSTSDDDQDMPRQSPHRQPRQQQDQELPGVRSQPTQCRQDNGEITNPDSCRKCGLPQRSYSDSGVTMGRMSYERENSTNSEQSVETCPDNVPSENSDNGLNMETCESTLSGKKDEHDVVKGSCEIADDSWVVVDQSETIQKVVNDVKRLTAECIGDGKAESNESQIGEKSLVNGFNKATDLPNHNGESLNRISKNEGGSDQSMDEDETKKSENHVWKGQKKVGDATISDASDNSTDNEISYLRKTKSESWLLNISSRFSPKLLRLRQGRCTPPIAKISQAFAKGETYKPLRFSLKKKSLGISDDGCSVSSVDSDSSGSCIEKRIHFSKQHKTKTAESIQVDLCSCNGEVEDNDDSDKMKNINNGTENDTENLVTADPSTCKRYYHVFKEGELVNLVEEHVESLYVLQSYYDHANWCVVAEKVQVWKI
ncbi:uncharacterized protein LOC102805961 [Saccoglossus kowalevskii]|uniref:Uncharacterized protein LOC102805961 n=1 Tax=Saccoglossus kowalevskii TaxID=10224 RepID=A0ABM0M2Y8_SACKO|nr:PREDICTED: uncharacterized protein LOC102805961 [Saccoglossus kowalevskii]